MLLAEAETPSCANVMHDPYFKPQPIYPHHDCYIDEAGSIIVPNFSAWWIPSVTIREEISGTLYTITSSFEGNESLLQKLKRISAKNILESPEDKNDK